MLSPSLVRMVALLTLLLFLMSALVWWVEDYSSLFKYGGRVPCIALSKSLRLFLLVMAMRRLLMRPEGVILNGDLCHP